MLDIKIFNLFYYKNIFPVTFHTKIMYIIVKAIDLVKILYLVTRTRNRIHLRYAKLAYHSFDFLIFHIIACANMGIVARDGIFANILVT